MRWKVEALPMDAEPVVKRAAEVRAALVVYLSERRRALALVDGPNPWLDEWQERNKR